MNKEGSEFLPKQYRSASLTSHIIKAFERVIKNAEHLTNNNCEKEDQHEFVL